MRRIGLMDCNNFFVSCERLFRPDLRNKPVAVLSSNDGCIVARSQEVKDLGIAMGVPYFQVKDMCKKEGITLFSSNFPLYRDISSRVMGALKEEFPMCEIYSVDEAFFEVRDDMTPADIGVIRSHIMQKTGIPVSFGVGTTKTIAKMASTYAKRTSNGVCCMDADAWNRVTPEISCGKIWGIGRQTTQVLKKLGIQTVEQLLAQDRSFFTNTLGVVGERLRLELSGIPAYGVHDIHESENESISSTRSFKDVVHKRSVLESALGYHVSHIAEKMRTRHVVAERLTIITAPSRFSDFTFKKSTATVQLLEPSNDTQTLLKEALKLARTIYDSEIPYKKAGVIVSHIYPETVTVKSLFGEPNTHQELNNVTDVLNKRFGKGTLRSGVILSMDKWTESKKLKSPEYTTSWSEIACVKAI